MNKSNTMDMYFDPDTWGFRQLREWSFNGQYAVMSHTCDFWNDAQTSTYTERVSNIQVDRMTPVYDVTDFPLAYYHKFTRIGSGAWRIMDKATATNILIDVLRAVRWRV